MDTPILYYAFCIVALVVGFLLVKKIAGCIIKTIIMVAIVAVLAIIYFYYFAQ